MSRIPPWVVASAAVIFLAALWLFLGRVEREEGAEGRSGNEVSGATTTASPDAETNQAKGVERAFRTRLEVDAPVQYTRVALLAETVPKMADRLAEVAAGTSPMVWRTVSNITLAGHSAWLERHRGLSDADIRELEARDIASSTVFTEEGAPFRELLQEWRSPRDQLDHLHRRVMEIADTYSRLGPDPAVGTDPDAPEEFQPFLEADRAQHLLWSDQLRKAYLEVIKVELTGSIPELDGFLNRLLALDPPPRIPPLGY